MSATTRDWLLQKLLKMKESLIAVTQERNAEREAVMATQQELQREREEHNIRVREIHSEFNVERGELLQRIRQMAPEKQFRVIYHPRVGLPYEARLRAVQSANGVTTIHAEWDGTDDRYDEPGANNGAVSSGAVPAGTTPISYGAGLGRHRC